MENPERVYYWSELHESHLRRAIHPLMLNEGGRLEMIDCILKDDSPRSPIPPQTRQVIFDKDFVVYRVVRLLAPLDWYEVKKLLADFSKQIKGSGSVPDIVKELISPPSPSLPDTSIPTPALIPAVSPLPSPPDSLPSAGKGTDNQLPINPDSLPAKAAKTTKTSKVEASEKAGKNKNEEKSNQEANKK